MSFERPITIKEAVENINKKNYLLPAIQREFEWEPEQIELLYDSLMRGFPIGSFLFWDVEKEECLNYRYYEFIRDYHERDNTHNPKADIKGGEKFLAIIDGQQRLTAFYLGLKGSYAYRLPRKRWNNDWAFPKRKLCLNLLTPAQEEGKEYDFRFLTEEEYELRNEETFWFKVGDVLEFNEPYKVSDYLIENELSSIPKNKALFANKTLFKLSKVIHDEPVINYFLEKENNLDKVLQIFIRMNSGGTELSYSDLLLSIATALWQKKDAREEINGLVDKINNAGNGFDFDKDFVLKTSLVLSDFTDIGFKVDNFNEANMSIIEHNWDKISKAIQLAVLLTASFGYNRDTLTSNYVLIPIAYYLLKLELPNNFYKSSYYKEDRDNILKWVIMSLLKRAFGGTPDNVLRPIRHILSQVYDYYPIADIIERFKATTKSIVFTEDDIDNLFNYKYGQNYTFSTLALLYPSLDFRNKFHQDHIFPKKYFTMKKLLKYGIKEHKIESYLYYFNRLANLQLLEGTPNLEKSGKDFGVWLLERVPDKRSRREYMEKHFIPDVELSLDNFLLFISERKKLMQVKYKVLLQ